MRSVWWNVVLVGGLGGGLVGCAPPVVNVRHVLPAVLPMPGDIAAVRAEPFTVRSGPKDGFAAFLSESLDKHLAGLSLGLASAGGSEQIAEARTAGAGGEIDIETNDVRGTRSVRRPDGPSGQLEDVELPTLVRTAAVRVEFHLRRMDSREPLGTVEVRRAYSSAADAGVRGELGLERADDPARVPPVEQIVHRLLGECAEAFRGMVSPVVAGAQVPLRPAAGRYAQLGLSAAREADWHEAIKQFEAAVREAPDDANAHFDLAAVAEVGGKLDLAATHYQRAWELSQEKDAEAKAGADRTRRVLAARASPKAPTGGS